MKIRTDFVTNSSSSSFVFGLKFELKNGEELIFDGEGACGEIGSTEFFDGEAIVGVSPKVLGQSSSVDDLIRILTDSVEDSCEYRKIFLPRELSESDIEFLEQGGMIAESAESFIEEIRENIKTIDDIKSIVVYGNEENYVSYRQTYKYDLETGEYIGAIFGCEFESEGSSGYIYIPDSSECKIAQMWNDNRGDYDRLFDYMYNGSDDESYDKEMEIILNNSIAMEEKRIEEEREKFQYSYVREKPQAEYLLEEIEKLQRLDNMAIALTGFGYYDEESTKNLICELGGIYKDHVTKKTNYLICAHLDCDSFKRRKALEYNDNGGQIQFINKNDFYEMLKNHTLPFSPNFFEEDRIAKLQKVYDDATKFMSKNTLLGYEKALEKFNSIIDFKDVKEKIAICENKKNEIKKSILEEEESKRIAQEEKRKQKEIKEKEAEEIRQKKESEKQEKARLEELKQIEKKAQKEAELLRRKEASLNAIPLSKAPEKTQIMAKRLFAKLDELFPDKNVEYLDTKHDHQAEKALEISRALGYVNKNDFLEAYGYVIVLHSADVAENKGGRPKSVDPNAVINQLKEKYPNGSPFHSIHELRQAEPELSKNLKTLANNAQELFGMPFSKYLISIGILSKR